MLLAEFEVFQSRPIAPTRRVALGRSTLPVEVSPGFGGLLLGAVVAAFADELDEDDLPDITRLTHQVEQGHRIPQPRLRHRLQVDHVGLSRRTHRLFGEGEELRPSIDRQDGTKPEAQVLAAVYAAGLLPPVVRGAVMELLRRGLLWRGPVDAGLLEYLTGRTAAGGWVAAGSSDPVAWALGVLGIDGDAAVKSAVQQAFRDQLRDAHPDHGGDSDDAAKRIADLTEARRILLRD